MSNHYKIGALVRCTGRFTDGGNPVDPDVVTFKFENPTPTITTYVYGTNAQLKKASTGHYYVDVPVTAAGEWSYQFVSTGTAQAANEIHLYRRRPPTSKETPNP